MPAGALNRSDVVAHLLGTTACTAMAITAPRAFARTQYGNRNPQRGGVGQITEGFQRQFRVPAMSIAVSKGGRFVFDHAGGMADREHALQAQQDSLFRIADLSKPITAVTIFSLIEAGKLKLSGSLPGSTGLVMRRPDGSCSAAVCNTRTQPHAEMDSALYQTMSELMQNVRG